MVIRDTEPRAAEASSEDVRRHPLPLLTNEEQSCWEEFFESAVLLYETFNAALLSAHRVGLLDVHVLYLLNSAPGKSIRMGALSKALAFSPSRVTQQVRRLEANGMVARVASAADRRVVLAKITATGRERLHQALRTYAREVRNRYLAPLSRQQMTALGASARRINDALMR